VKQPEKIRIVLEGLRGEIAISDEVRALKDENATLKKALAGSVLETMKHKIGWARREKLKRDTLSRRRVVNHQPQGPDGAKPYLKSGPENFHSF